MKQPVQTRGVNQREKILTAAIGILLERGTEGVTHRNVATAAGTSLGAIRYYFTSREQLLLACIESLEVRRRDAGKGALDAWPASDGAAGATDLVDPTVLAEALIQVFFGGTDEELLKGTVGWVVDVTRESPLLAERLRTHRSVIDAQMGELLTRAGLPAASVKLLGAVADGAIVSALAEGLDHIFLSTRDLLVEQIELVQAPTRVRGAQ